MNGLVVCVNYADFLARTLPRNASHFDHIVVVTTPDDVATRAVVHGCDHAELFVTQAFTKHGAVFNKGLAIEEGFDFLGRDGWMCVWDADTVMPRDMDLNDLPPNRLYAPRRRICSKPERWDDGEDWRRFPRYRDREFAGYFQLFHASDPVLATRPWYGTHWRHAGGCDSDFQAKWPRERKVRLPFDVLHLGKPGVNWAGRTPDHQHILRQLRSDRSKHGYTQEQLQNTFTNVE